MLLLRAIFLCFHVQIYIYYFNYCTVVSTKNNFNKYKSEILFPKKRPKQDFIIKTLHGSISVVPLTSTYILVRPRIFYIGGPFKAVWPSNEENHATYLK